MPLCFLGGVNKTSVGLGSFSGHLQYKHVWENLHDDGAKYLPAFHDIQRTDEHSFPRGSSPELTALVGIRRSLYIRANSVEIKQLNVELRPVRSSRCCSLLTESHIIAMPHAPRVLIVCSQNQDFHRCGKCELNTEE